MWLAADVVGTASIILLFAGGSIFMQTNGGAMASMAMATSCVAAIATYAVALARR
jgi:hypothetical protein